MDETVEAIQEKLSPEHIKGRMKYKVREAAVGRAKDIANRTGSRAKEIGGMTREQARRAQGWLQDWMQGNPLAVGAVLFAFGAIVGFGIPETRKEQELTGEAREAAQETAQRARKVAERVKETAKEEAEKQGVLR